MCSESPRRLTFCVKGNISVGKTTFLQRIVNETLELQDLVEIVPEPINKWQDVGPDHFNILDAFYAEAQRYACTFQNCVFVTRVMQERESSGGLKPLRLMERSVFSDVMVFVRAVNEANWLNEMEIKIYDSWFDPVVSCLPGLIPDGFIYLRAIPDTYHKRMLPRKRAEEGGVTLEYLCDLHEKHESWLFPFQSGHHGVLSVSKLPHKMDCCLHPDIRDCSIWRVIICIWAFKRFLLWFWNANQTLILVKILKQSGKYINPFKATHVNCKLRVFNSVRVQLDYLAMLVMLLMGKFCLHALL